MELIVISESKLKITLSPPDMRRYELETNRMDCTDAHTRAAFRQIFDDARAEIGFETEGERLFIQLYMSKEGGCEIFVTKLGGCRDSFPVYETENMFEEDIEEAQDQSILAIVPDGLSAGEKALLKQVYSCGEEDREMQQVDRERQISKIGVRMAIIHFSALENLLTVCRRLLREGYRGRSSAYIDETVTGTPWYLMLEIPDVTHYRLPRRFAFLTEYGSEMNHTGLLLYLTEYGRCILEKDAVEMLGRM